MRELEQLGTGSQLMLHSLFLEILISLAGGGSIVGGHESPPCAETDRPERVRIAQAGQALAFLSLARLEETHGSSFRLRYCGQAY